MKWFLTFLFVLQIAQTVEAATCAQNLNLQRNQDHTEGLISYLEVLVERKILDINQLTQFALNLRNGQLINLLVEDKVDSTTFVHRQEIQRYLKRPLDLEKLLRWASEASRRFERTKVSQETAKEETQSTHLRMEFLPVPAGEFNMTAPKARIRLTHPFEMMSTPVTQSQWVALMNYNPSRFQYGAESINIVMNGAEISMQPDHPVEHVNWWSAIVFANMLSQKAGLKPAYDLSDLKFQENTKARRGNLEYRSGKLRFNAPNNDIYQTQGYRLPTSAEFEYVMRRAGREETEYFFGNLLPPLAEYALFGARTESTQAVAQLKPLTIDGKQFFDVLGNVAEWTQDCFVKEQPDASDPVFGPFLDDRPYMQRWQRVVRGGHWFSGEGELSADYREGQNPSSDHTFIGFRLVRTLK